MKDPYTKGDTITVEEFYYEFYDTDAELDWDYDDENDVYVYVGDDDDTSNG